MTSATRKLNGTKNGLAELAANTMIGNQSGVPNEIADRITEQSNPPAESAPADSPVEDKPVSIRQQVHQAFYFVALGTGSSLATLLAETRRRGISDADVRQVIREEEYDGSQGEGFRCLRNDAGVGFIMENFYGEFGTMASANELFMELGIPDVKQPDGRDTSPAFHPVNRLVIDPESPRPLPESLDSPVDADAAVKCSQEIFNASDAAAGESEPVDSPIPVDLPFYELSEAQQASLKTDKDRCLRWYVARYSSPERRAELFHTAEEFSPTSCAVVEILQELCDVQCVEIGVLIEECYNRGIQGDRVQRTLGELASLEFVYLWRAQSGAYVVQIANLPSNATFADLFDVVNAASTHFHDVRKKEIQRLQARQPAETAVQPV